MYHSRVQLKPIILSICLLTSCQLFSQTVGGGGGGGLGSFVIEPIRTGSNTWKVPKYDGISWHQKIIVCNFDEGVAGFGKWYEDGLPTPGNTAPGIPTQWSSAPSYCNTGSIALTGTIKFNLYGGSGMAGQTIWVGLNSSATVSFYAWASSIHADDGLGDEAIGNGTWQDSHGKHLKKVTLDENGIGHYTVSIDAHGEASATNATMEGSVGCSMWLDPRSVSLPANFKAKPLSVTDTNSIDYMSLDGTTERTKLIHFPDGDQSVVWAKEPLGVTHTKTLTFHKADRVFNEPISTDALSLFMDGKVAYPPTAMRRYIDDSPGGWGGIRTVGQDTRDIDFSALFAGATDEAMRPTIASVTYNSASNSATLNGVYGSVGVTVPIKVDCVLKDQVPIVPVSTTTLGEESGTYTGAFTWSDGVKGETKWTIHNVHASDLDEEVTQARCFVPGPVTSTFKSATDWTSSDDAEIVDQPGHQDTAMLTNGAVGGAMIYLAATDALCPAVGVILSIIDCGLGSYLDSTSIYGRVSRTVNVETDQWWTMDNYDSLKLVDLSATSFEELLDESDWMLCAAPNATLHVQSRNLYDTEGFRSRGKGGYWDAPTLNSAGRNYQRWYHFKYNPPLTNGGPG